MVNTKILIPAIIVALIGIGVAAAGYQISSTTPGLWQPSNSQEQQFTDQSGQQSIRTQGEDDIWGQSGNGGSNVKITQVQAKSIAQESIEEPGATTGTPKLVTINGTKIYIVPVMDNSKQVGEFEIDAQTGKIIGGAGGAP